MRSFGSLAVRFTIYLAFSIFTMCLISKFFTVPDFSCWILGALHVCGFSPSAPSLAPSPKGIGEWVRFLDLPFFSARKGIVLFIHNSYSSCTWISVQ